MINISDMTMKQTALSLSFKEKIELAKHLDRLGVSVIELEGVGTSRTDALRIKSIASAVNDSIIAVPVELDQDSVERTWNALMLARYPRLQVCASVSPVQMEYLFHKKPDAMLQAIDSTIRACCALCPTEFIADDATRSESDFLCRVIETAIAAGAGTITVCDTAGTMLPGEFEAFISDLYARVPALRTVTLGVSCANDLSMADACTIAAVRCGAGEVKTAAQPVNTAALSNVVSIITARGESFGAACGVRVTQLSRTMDQIAWLCHSGGAKSSAAADSKQDDEDIYLTDHDDKAAVLKAVEQLGYDLSEEDGARVFDAFRPIAEKKGKVNIKELDAIVASAAMQVPQTYTLDTYVITSGNTISATAHMKLLRQGEVLEGVRIGDGPIDAAFLAIENITGRHYELDDFQIRAVTEGREAMGQTVVKLRSEGKVYSGRGISTDIVGASIHAYLSALNKIAYEEAEG